MVNCHGVKQTRCWILTRTSKFYHISTRRKSITKTIKQGSFKAFIIELTQQHFQDLEVILKYAQQVIPYSKLRKYPVNIYLFNVDNRNTRKRCEICSNLTIKIMLCLICSKLWTKTPEIHSFILFSLHKKWSFSLRIPLVNAGIWKYMDAHRKKIYLDSPRY